MKLCRLEMDLLVVQCKLLNKLKDLKSTHQRILHLKAKVKLFLSVKEDSKPITLTSGVMVAINMMVKNYFPMYSTKYLSEEVAEGIWSSEGLKGIVRRYLQVLMKQQLSATVFSLMNVTQALDLFGGMLSFQSIHMLCWIEMVTRCTITTKLFHLLPSSNTL